jgi:dTDP-4-amino-4,6-dideoxygalactose transaminase
MVSTASFLARLRPLVRGVARATVGRLPPPAARLSGPLAQEGGIPVRNTRYRPWKGLDDGNAADWRGGLAAQFRRIFLTGAEGLPQPLATEFAARWAAFCGCRYGLLLPHGTDALRIGLAAALDHDGLDYGGEVIVPNFSFIASATAALDRRLGVAFVDVDPQTLLIDPARVEEAIVPGKTRAIMAVHLFGQPADMTALRAIADRHGLKLIEDAAQAHGARWQDGPAGALGDVAGFSFQSFKNLSSGEGGALVTNDEQIFDRAYSMHNAGRARIDGGRWEHVTLGWNCRPTEYQAAVLLQRFKSFERKQAVRLKNFMRLREMMGEVKSLLPLALNAGTRRHGVHMFAVRYQPEYGGGRTLDQFLELLRHEGVPIYRSFAATMAGQLAIKKLMQTRPEYFRLLHTPVADQAAEDTAYIAQQIFLGSEADMADIAAAVRKVERAVGGKRTGKRGAP